MNREAWLTRAVKQLRPIFTRRKLKLPSTRVQVSCGWPSSRGTSLRLKRTGECWPREATDNGMHHIFISPAIERPQHVLAVLLHELAHVQVGHQHKHGGPFVMVAYRLGFIAPVRQVVVSPTLLMELRRIARRLGPYPHSAINITKVERQPTRLLKVQCPKCCYTVRVTRKWLDLWGAPICPKERKGMVEVDGE